jgi:hemerythrin-like domain-containing protein
MTDTATIVRQEPLSDDMRLLLRDYPRDAWPDHPNFARSIEKWMEAHSMFRQLGDLLRSETELYLDRERDPEDYAGRLSIYGNLLVRNLHGHHSWEDRKFFPELSAADGRFDPGIEVLESDHAALDGVLDRLTGEANRVIKLVQLDKGQAREEAGNVLESARAVEALLGRHLADEEDLAVPILLHHKLRG